MGHHSGRVHRIPKDLPGQISLSSQMGRSSVQQAALSMHKSGDRSAMVRCGCCMRRESAIVARVRCASGVKNRRRPSKRDGSVPSIGLSLPIRRSQASPHLHQGHLHLCRFLIQYSGETGRAASTGGRWCRRGIKLSPLVELRFASMLIIPHSNFGL
jgi:hypothetical protein